MLQRLEIFSPRPDVPELPLGGFMPSNDPVQVRNIEGLGPVKAEVSSTPLATGRGERPQGVSTGKRNIVMTLGLNPDWEDQTVSTLRQLLYGYLMPEQWCKLRFFSDYLPTCQIEGVVESFEPNIFSVDPEVQVSIICHNPDFVDVDATIITGLVDDGTIEMVFDYIGTVETGYELRIEATEANLDYTGSLVITTTAWGVPTVYEVDPVTIDATTYFKLNSVKGLRRVQNIEVVDGAATNLLAAVSDESDWPVLKAGECTIKIAATENDQAWTLAYFTRFGGL
jgi:hypothetical protein